MREQQVKRGVAVRLASIVLGLGTLTLAGCGIGNRAASSAAPESTGGAPGVAISGMVHGGQQPISGATIQLYSVGTAGDASSATALISSKITTNSTGGFSITGKYACPTATGNFPGHVYIVATGGDPGLGSGVTNSQSALMAALGPCSSLSSSTYISINEITTVGAVAALYPYMKGYTAVGVGTTNATAFTTAMSQVKQFVNVASGGTPGTLPTGSAFSTATLISLANAVSACINSSGGTSSSTSCGTLFNAARYSNGVTPTDTIGALVDIFKIPANNLSGNIASIWGLIPASPPFQTGLTSAPTTWSMPITSTVGSAGSLQFSAASYPVNESAGSVTVSVTRTGGSTGAVSVNYSTEDVVAAAGFDYTAQTGTLTWADGNSATQTIVIPIADENISNNGYNNFGLVLTAPTGGAVLGSQPWTNVAIYDNDAAAVDFVVASGTYAVNENAGTVQVGIKRQNTQAGGTTYTVNYTTANLEQRQGAAPSSIYIQQAYAGTDYTAESGSVTFTSSTSSPQYINIPILDRGLTDGSQRSFLFEISVAQGGPNLGETNYAIVTIADNDTADGTIALASATASANENAGVAELLVTRTSGSTTAATVNYATSNGTAVAGTDYTSTTGTLSWAAGDATTRIIDVPIADENLTSGSKTFTVTLSGVTGATLGTSSSTVTVNDNDSSPGTLALSAGTYSVNENAGTLTIPVVRSGGSSGTVSVNYNTQDATAVAGTDYTAASGTLTFGTGVAMQTISVPISDELLSTGGTKTFFVQLSNVSGTIFAAPTSAIVTINDNDSAGSGSTLQLSASSYATTESSGAVALTVNRTGSTTGTVTVNYATSNYSATSGTDYLASSGTLTFGPGVTTQQISTSIYDVNLYSGSRTFYVALSSPSAGAVIGANSSASVVISENDSILYPTSDAFANQIDDSYSNITDPVTDKAVTYTWGQFPANDFGADPIAYGTNGYTLASISALPAAQSHPRVLFTAADLPAIQARLTGSNATVSGKLLYNKLAAYSAGLHGTYSDTAAYAYPDLFLGSYEGSHGNVYILDYKDPNSLWFPANHTYADLIAGVQPVSVETGLPLNTTVLWSNFAYEALYCLINNDTAGMQNLAAAVTFEMTNEQAARAADSAAYPAPYAQTIGGGDSGFYLGYLYDWLYNVLTPTQKLQWTNELASTTWYADNYGTLGTAVAARSNWATFTYRTPQLLAWKGETDYNQGQLGYNDIKEAGLQRGMQNFMTYGIFPSGTYIEGEAKDQLGAEALIMMARFGYQNLFEHPHLQAYVHNFLPASVIPNPAYVDPSNQFPSGPFLTYDLLGGLKYLQNNDMVVLHYMFQNDPVVDWMYQLQNGSTYNNLSMGVDGSSAGPPYASSGGPYYDDFLTSIAYATDFNAANSNPATLGLPVTYFSGERALMITRSDWASTNAMMLAMHVREFNGGHPMDDRNSIFLFGEGRAWTVINQANSYNNAQSIVNIDGNLASPPTQSVTTPGRMVDFQDQTYATFAVGDASYCWDWIDTTPGTGYSPSEIAAGKFTVPTGSTYETHSKNSFAYTQLASDEMNTPLSSLPSWVDYNGLVTPVTKAPLLPVLKAFRTAGLVRGPSTGVTPYGLVVDDYEVSATVAHHYDWQLLLENDLNIVGGSATSLQATEGIYDINLAANGTANPGDPMLLIRVLDLNTTCTSSPCTPYILPASSTNTRADSNRPLFIIPSDSISPNYKILIFPYTLGDTLPTTTWNESHTAVTINMPTFTDVVTFTPAASGKTDVNITRNGTQIINMNTPIPALN